MNIVLLVIGVVAAILGIIIRILTKDTGYVKLGKHYAHPMIIGGLILLVFSQSFAIIPTGYYRSTNYIRTDDNRTVRMDLTGRFLLCSLINQVTQ